MHRHNVFVSATLLAVCSLGLAGCAVNRPVTSGEVVKVDFVCGSANQAVIAASNPKLLPKDLGPATVVVLPAQRNPLTLIAGEPAKPLSVMQAQEFQMQLAQGLAREASGMITGVPKRVVIEAEYLKNLAESDRFLRIARARTRPKELRLTREEFESRFGPAEVRKPFVLDPLIPGEIKTVTDAEVEVSFPLPAAVKVKTPFGPATIRDRGDVYEIVVDAAVGSLIRSGPLLGRVTAVSDSLITIDYGHPFGGESLVCDVTVEPAPDDKQPQKAEVLNQKNPG